MTLREREREREIFISDLHPPHSANYTKRPLSYNLQPLATKVCPSIIRTTVATHPGTWFCLGATWEKVTK